MKVLILGASYGALLGTKLLMAGHDVTLVCRAATAALINAEGTIVRIPLRGEPTPRSVASKGLPGRLDAAVPGDLDVAVDHYDLVALAMQEPQYADTEVRALMLRIAKAGKPCLSIMNMPPSPFLRRIPSATTLDVSACYAAPDVWAAFAPGLISLCSPDPQAYRPPEEPPNVLVVSLPTNFKAAPFEAPDHTALLTRLEADIDAVRLDGHEVPVKLRVGSLFTPLAKWSMLLAGNYRCVTPTAVVPIREAVHGDLDTSRAVYEWVADLARLLGAEAVDQVPFGKYAAAAEQLLKPSSVARAVAGGSVAIERVDLLVQLLGRHVGMTSEHVDVIVATVSARLAQNLEAGTDALHRN